jgi:predicted nucleotidyltransferase
MQFINKHIKNLNAICKKHQVNKLFVFGSVLTDNFKEESDIDFLVSFNHMDLYGYFDNYMSLKSELEKLFGRSVDLVEEQVLKNPILINNINKNKKLIYERESLEMVV